MLRSSGCQGPKLVSSIRLPESSALCLARSETHIFAGLASGVIRVWLASNLQHKCDLVGHSSSVLGLAYVDDDDQHRSHRCLVSASADSTVRVWSVTALKPLWTIFAPSESVGDILSLTVSAGRIVFGTQSCAILVRPRHTRRHF